MDNSSKKQLVSSFTTTRMVVALFLCLSLLGGFSYFVEVVALRINVYTVRKGYCVNDEDCDIHCRSMKCSGGICLPNDIVKEPFGICCCLN
ncbi:hypothetical protein MKW98_016920 [Papaver atlanticum]|uniref:Uncharacterized protein n=1 Tax=Papaver atlanticum TaxID=357466 RepID=A0AAD4TLN3_9MAGN|nr:hypothetical protein MKW98_016920 [Papaver atlanticum]